MKIPFLQKLTNLGGPPPRQVVGSGAAATALHHLLAELPELLLAAVLDTRRGELLASYAATRSYPPAAIAGPAAAMVQQVQAGLAAQGQPAGELHELVLTLSTQLHLLRLGPGGQQLLYLAVEARDTNLALASQLAEQAAAHLTE
ncbi:MAG: hypothetical protein ACRYFK_07150 [Janthinobacterium lividum]